MSRAEYDLWTKNIPKEKCMFCDQNEQFILKEGYEWLWVANIAPYWYYHTMLIPKRHFVEYWDMTNDEAIELKQLSKYVINRYRQAKLLRSDNTEIKKYVFFWRLRDDRFDPISGNIRPDHFHLHIAPDKDHLWDPTLDENAYKVDIRKLI